MNIPSPDTLIHLLAKEMRTSTGFVRIHAAEALIEHGHGSTSGEVQHDADAANPPYRIGVWRVLARIAADESQRQPFIALLRGIMRDGSAPDRIFATETLAKLQAVDRADRAVLQSWLRDADDATAAFPRWLLALSSDETERTHDESALSALLESQSEVARLRAAYAIGWLERLSDSSLAMLRHRAQGEPSNSGARIYVLAAVFLNSSIEEPEASRLKASLLAYVETGKPNEKFEAATVIGLRGSPTDIRALQPLLNDAEADPRIAAANAILHLLSSKKIPNGRSR